jgi:hypothetical protein
MRSSSVCYMGSAVLLAMLSLAPVPTRAQNGTAADKPTGTTGSTETSTNKRCMGCSVDGKTTPRTADGHPDLSGVWDNPFAGVVATRPDGSYSFRLGVPKDPNKPARVRTPASEPSYKPEYAAKVQDILDRTFGPTSALDPLQHCKPLGVPRVVNTPFQIVQTPGLVVILFEPDTVGEIFRTIYTDGRDHPKDLDSSYMGDSIGHWDGDTLVVDVTGLNDETWLGGGQGVEPRALMHSDQEHVTERFSRSGNVLSYEATVEDPVVLAKPWVITPRHFTHGDADDQIYETYCDNHDLSHFVEPDRWAFTVQGSHGPVTQTLLLQPDCDPHRCLLTGALKEQSGEAELNGTLEGQKISFSVKRNTSDAETTQQYVGTVQGDLMKGTTKVGEDNQTWTAKKVAKQ